MKGLLFLFAMWDLQFNPYISAVNFYISAAFRPIFSSTTNTTFLCIASMNVCVECRSYLTVNIRHIYPSDKIHRGTSSGNVCDYILSTTKTEQIALSRRFRPNFIIYKVTLRLYFDLWIQTKSKALSFIQKCFNANFYENISSTDPLECVVLLSQKLHFPVHLIAL